MIPLGSWVIAQISSHVAMTKRSLVAPLHVIIVDAAQGESAESVSRLQAIDINNGPGTGGLPGLKT